MATDHDDSTTYRVVVNTEEQYSVWPVRLAVPRGWTPVGSPGPKADCLRFVEEVWTDMRPLSLRRAAQRDSQDEPAGGAPGSSAS